VATAFVLMGVEKQFLVELPVISHGFIAEAET
jgi:hypothetical protein